jgi:putative hydrolase of the HAD superfamily
VTNAGIVGDWPGRDVELLSLDAGNTVVFLDHERLAASLARAGFAVSAEALIVAEDETMRAGFSGDALALDWSRARDAATRSWGIFMGTLLVKAGADRSAASAMLEPLFEEHVAFNFWWKVPDGLVSALAEARAAGLRLIVVSNSEGVLEPLLDRVGILKLFDHVFDSGVVGVEKPDPRIFHIALEAAGVPASRSLHIGDSDVDVRGALAAGLRAGIVDPRGRLEGLHPGVPRVPNAGDVARRLAAVATGRRA